MEPVAQTRDLMRRLKLLSPVCWWEALITANAGCTSVSLLTHSSLFHLLSQSPPLTELLSFRSPSTTKPVRPHSIDAAERQLPHYATDFISSGPQALLQEASEGGAW